MTTTIEYGVNEMSKSGVGNNPFPRNFDTVEEAVDEGKAFMRENPEVERIQIFQLTIRDDEIVGDETLETILRQELEQIQDTSQGALMTATTKSEQELIDEKDARKEAEYWKMLEPIDSGRYIGPIVEVRDGKAIQDSGRGKLVVHDVDKFPEPPVAGKKMDISYRDRIMTAAKDLAQDGHQVGVTINTR